MSLSGRTSPIVSPSRKVRSSSLRVAVERETDCDAEDLGSSGYAYSPLSSATSSPVRSNAQSIAPTTFSSSHTETEAPPNYVSPTRSINSRTSTVNSKYSSLMQYLESEIGEDGDQYEDDLSSMSMSPGARSAGGIPKPVQGISSHFDRSPSKSLSQKESAATQTFSSTRMQTQSNASVGSRITRGGRTYIWDSMHVGTDGESGLAKTGNVDGELGHDAFDGEGENATYFSMTSTLPSTTTLGTRSRRKENDPENEGSSSSSPSRLRVQRIDKNRDDDGISCVGNATGAASKSTLQTVVDDVKGKVELMRTELQSYNNRAKELQVELVRLNTAQARREHKFKTLWESRVKVQREEQSSVLKKQRDLADRLSGDVRQLQEKHNALLEKSAKMLASREQALALLKDECRRRCSRTRKQWDLDEKVAFDKVLASKAEAMKKAAADSFGPALDHMVKEGKAKVLALEDENAARLARLQRSLQAELETKASEAQQQMRESLQLEEEKARRQGERRLDDALRRQADEVTALREKFARERKIVEEAAERTRRIDAETALEGMREVRRAEAQQVMELMAQQQRELGQLAQAHAEGLTQLRSQLQARERELGEKMRKQLEQEAGDRQGRARAAALARAAAEAETVLQRVREEVLAERRKVRDALDAELEELRVNAQSRLEHMHLAEQRSVERAAGLRGEIESMRKRLGSIEDDSTARTRDLAEVKQRLSALRLDLRAVEAEAESTEARLAEARGDRRALLARKEEVLQREVEQAEEALARQEVAVANKKEDARADYARDIMRIRDKVASLLQQKDSSAKELRRQLSALQGRAAQLQEQVDSYREAQLGGMGNDTMTVAGSLTISGRDRETSSASNRGVTSNRTVTSSTTRRDG